MNLDVTAASGEGYTHLWDISTQKVYDGGFKLDTASLPTAAEKVYRGTVVSCNLTTRVATVVKTAIIQTAVGSGDTVVKITKDHNLIATDVIGIGGTTVTVGTITTSNAAYDSFVITANQLGEITKDSVLSESIVAKIPSGLLINDVDVTEDEPSCSAAFALDGVIVSELPQGLTTEIKAAMPFIQFLNL